MTSYAKVLADKLSVPRWLPDNTMFEGITGSVSYGVSGDMSDMDIVGFCIPPKEIIFPHLGGEIMGFGSQHKRFDCYQEHHIKHNNREYDISIYSIVKYFQLAMENNPNMVDSLFAPRRCVLHSTAIYEHIRDNRKLFLHKGCWPKFRGYAYSQLSKVSGRKNSSSPKRAESIEKYGLDCKFAYHIIRLMLECEQILEEGDLNIERNSAILKSVRNGEWSVEKIEEWFSNKEKSMETLYANSSIPSVAQEGKIKKLLLECLESHYGDLSTTVSVSPDINNLVDELKYLVGKYS